MAYSVDFLGDETGLCPDKRTVFEVQPSIQTDNTRHQLTEVMLTDEFRCRAVFFVQRVEVRFVCQGRRFHTLYISQRWVDGSDYYFFFFDAKEHTLF